MINGQYPLQMWLRGMSLGLYVACAGLLPKSSFPITTTLLVICWVIAGIYGKWRREEEERERVERERKRREENWRR